MAGSPCPLESIMTEQTQGQQASIYRIDKFAVPAAARAEFLARVNETRAFLEGQIGCRQNLVLEVQSGSARFNVLTLVEWESQAAFEAARDAMIAERETTGFKPQTFLARLGVEADMAN